jgi:peptidyl-prolyl cis-trans isomerase D
MKKLALIAGAVGALAACDGFKEAMTAHVDVVAKAGSQELSVTRLADLLSSAGIPLTKQNARALANYWVDLQLLGRAAADRDTLTDPKTFEEATWSLTSNMRAKKWFDQVSKTFPQPNAADAEAAYNRGDVLAARHILLVTPPTGLSTGAQDQIAKKAAALRAQATPANFADLASKNSQDPGSKAQGGALGVFPKGAMVPEFEKALLALKPGQISPVVKTKFGYHIIYRQPYSEVKDQVAGATNGEATQAAESTYFAKLEQSGNIKVKDDAAKTVKAVAADVDAHRDDNTVVATSSAGDFTVARLVKYINAFPPQAQITTQLQNAPDTLLPRFVKSVVGKDLFLRQADSAKVTLDSSETNDLHRSFAALVVNVWNGLGVRPEELADSAKTASDKERLAATRVESYLDRALKQQAQFIQVPKPLEAALRAKFDAKVNDAGLDRAIERAAKVKATLDSTKAATQPKSEVPLPPAGAQPQPATPQPAAPQPAAPAPQKP